MVAQSVSAACGTASGSIPAPFFDPFFAWQIERRQIEQKKQENNSGCADCIASTLAIVQIMSATSRTIFDFQPFDSRWNLDGFVEVDTVN
jgi:hypothetical protein